MARVRLASLAVAVGLVFCSGCFPVLSSWWHRRGHGRDCECVCGDVGPHEAAGLEGPVVGPPDGLGAVPLMPPPGAPLGTPAPGQLGPPPRVVPIPQANPMPYTPGTTTKWFRR